MDAAQTTTTMDVAAGFGLLSSYSSAVDVVMAVVLDLAITDVVVITTLIAVNGLLSFLFFSLAVEITVLAANSHSQASSKRRLLTYVDMV